MIRPSKNSHYLSIALAEAMNEQGIGLAEMSGLALVSQSTLHTWFYGKYQSAGYQIGKPVGKMVSIVPNLQKLEKALAVVGKKLTIKDSEEEEEE